MAAAGGVPGRVDALIVAAGRGERAGGQLPKQFRSLLGRPALRWATEPFVRHPQIDRVVVVVAPGQQDAAAVALDGFDVRILPCGGATRQQSVAAGLEAMREEPPWAVLVHDGARPRPGAALISRVVDALSSADGVVPSLPVFDTLKTVSGDSCVQQTVPRSGLHTVQTPQGFRYDVIAAAHQGASAGPGVTDDAALMEGAGHVVRAVAGDVDNLKVTEPGDFARIERLLGGWTPRIGHGFDVHRFAPGSGVRLLGVDLPHDQSLVGHSDADVGLHAVTDALLGALGMGDIGEHFPPTDPQWRNADSALFVRHAAEAARTANAEIAHLDVTLICEEPRINPYRAEMRRTLADLAGVAAAAVNVKATTTEGLGFPGRREGIAALAMATLLFPVTST